MVTKECLYCMYSVNASKCKPFFPLILLVHFSVYFYLCGYLRYCKCLVNERMLILYIKNIEGKDLCVCVLCNYLGASLGTVHDSVAAVEREGVLKFRQTFLSEFITRVNHPPICLWDNHTVVICCLLHIFIFNIGSCRILCICYMLVNRLKCGNMLIRRIGHHYWVWFPTCHDSIPLQLNQICIMSFRGTMSRSDTTPLHGYIQQLM